MVNIHMKRHSTSAVGSEMQMRTLSRYITYTLKWITLKKMQNIWNSNDCWWGVSSYDHFGKPPGNI